MELFALIPLTAAVAWGGAALARRHALRRRMLDAPGERRSHQGEVPRGGGAGILAGLLVLIGVLVWFGELAPGEAAGIGGGLLAVGLTGWLDDHRPIPVPARLAAHLLAAAWLLWWLGGLATLEVGVTLELGAAGYVVAAAGIIWLTNLYNFMDGIDAFAAAEGLFAGTLIGIWLLLAGEPGLSLLALGIAAACAGFLPWNLPPARLFMGDVGSTSLGFAFAALVLRGEQSGTMAAPVGVLVLGLFVFDATFTLIARMARGARWYTPHREHAYQYMVRAGLDHGGAVVRLMAVNLLVILPLVALLYRWPGALGPVSAAAIAAAACLWFAARRHFSSRAGFSM